MWHAPAPRGIVCRLTGPSPPPRSISPMRGRLRPLRFRDTDYRYGARFALRSFLLPLNLRLVSLRRATLARRQRVVMITGSQGKTTTTRCVRAALGVPADRDVMLSPNLPRSIV